VVRGHRHHFDHTTLVLSGSVRVRRTGPGGVDETRVFVAPAHFLVDAECEHEITFLEPGEFWCVYAHRDPQGRVTQHYTGWEDAYT
jgi:hypothetical protein